MKKVEPEPWTLDYIKDLESLKRYFIKNHMTLSFNERFNEVQKGFVIGISEAIKILKRYIDLPEIEN